MSSTAITPTQKMATLRELLEKSRASLATVLPRHLTPDKMMKLALVAASRNPVLLQCDQRTVLQSVMTAAQLGLDPSGTLGSAYLVPYRNKKKGTFECQLIPGYRGLIDLARRSGEIESIEAHVVYEHDTFDVEYGLEPKLTHKPHLSGEAGAVVLVYAVARLKGGARQTEVMTRAQVEAIRSRSRASIDGPWSTDYDEMARKTVVRRLCKYLPLSPELAEALSLGEEEPQTITLEALPAEEPEEPQEPQSKASDLAARLKGESAEEAA